MRIAKSFAKLLTLSFVALTACEGSHNVAAPTFDVTTQSGAIVSNLTVCKYGSAASFSQVVNGTAGLDFSLSNGECITADSHANFTPAQIITVTEHVPAGTRLDSIVGTSTATGLRIFVLGDTANSITVRIGDDQGQVVKFYNTQLPEGQIGDFVWNDLNGNGIQDAGEPGLAGQPVTLSGPVNATTTTDANGNYLFAGLPAGSYTVTVGTPAGFNPSPTGAGTTATDNNGSPASVTLPTNTSIDLTIDFGFVPPSGQIGDYVWEDDNGDGLQDVTETGIAGVTVMLTGPVNATTTTDANGNYLFTGLPAGSYTVTVGTPAGLSPSPSNQGSDTNMDSNGSPASVTLPTNSSVDLSIDFGFVPPPTRNPGRMTGGGKLIDVGNVSFNLGLTLHCDILLSNNLEINWPGSAGVNNFHITRPLTSATCILDPHYRQQPPAAPFNTFIGVANGTLNGIPGATARFTFIDAGEPGRNDRITLQVFDANNNLVLDVPQSNLDHGNLQAHYDQPHGQHGH